MSSSSSRLAEYSTTTCGIPLAPSGIRHGVSQGSNLRDSNFDDVARFQPARGIKPSAGASWRPRENEIAGFQCRERRDVFNELAKTEDHTLGSIVLTQFTVDPRCYSKRTFKIDFRSRHHPRAHAPGGVEVF